MLDLKTVLNAITETIGDNVSSLHEPNFTGNEWQYVKECVDTNWVSTAGSYVNRFEELLSEITGAKHVIATSSGTAALHAALILADVGNDDEVLVPALTYVSTANAVTYCGATPHFVDVEDETYGVDGDKLEKYLNSIAKKSNGHLTNKHTNKKIKALVVVHTFGHTANLQELIQVCDKYGLILIEDAAEAIGSLYKNQHAGTWGKIGILSFNGNKVVTTGGGGSLLTNDDELAALARRLTDMGKAPHQWERKHDIIGFNYRLPNLNAALGCAQLEKLDELMQHKRNLAARYQGAFQKVNGAQFVVEPKDCFSNYWMNSIMLDSKYAHLRDDLIEFCNKSGVRVQPIWTPLHQLPMYKEFQRMDLSKTETLFQGLINLPSSPSLVIH